MNRLRSTLLLGLLCGSLVTVPTQWAGAQGGPAKPAPAKPAPAKGPGACASVKGTVRAEAFGYKHIVTLFNGCDKAVECQIWTDVDPSPRQLLTAAPGESVEVVTRIGSPAFEVTAHSECKFR
jgi:hypothetical protein